jgi:hypothetical protein
MASFGHALTGTAGHQKRAAQIDVDFAIPIVHAHPFNRVHLAENASGIDKAGHRTMGGFDSGDAADDGALACDVQRVRPQDRLRARQGFGCDICDHDTPALLREQDRGRGADAAAAAGHENNAFGGHDCLSSSRGANNPRVISFS